MGSGGTVHLPGVCHHDSISFFYKRSALFPTVEALNLLIVQLQPVCVYQGSGAPRRGHQLGQLCVSLSSFCLESPFFLSLSFSLPLSVFFPPPSPSLCIPPSPTLSPSLNFSLPFFPLLPCSPSSSPMPHTFVSVNFSIAPFTSQCLPSLQGSSMTPSPAILPYPHQAWKGPGLPATPGLIPQRFFKAPILASGCVWVPGRGQGAGLPDAPAEFKVPPKEHFLDWGGWHRVQDAQRPRCCGGKLPGCLLSAQGNSEVLCVTYSKASPGSGLPMGQWAPWGSETLISILKKGQQESISETCWEQEARCWGKFTTPRLPTSPSADKVAFERAEKAPDKEEGVVDSNFSSVTDKKRVWAGYLLSLNLTSLPSQEKKSNKVFSEFLPALELWWSREAAEVGDCCPPAWGKALEQTLALCVTLDGILDLSEPQFPNLSSEGKTYFMGSCENWTK